MRSLGFQSHITALILKKQSLKADFSWIDFAQTHFAPVP